jgi:hypothetical protein
MIAEVLEQTYLVGLKKFVSLVQEIGVHLMRSRENSPIVGSSTSLLRALLREARLPPTDHPP